MGLSFDSPWSLLLLAIVPLLWLLSFRSLAGLGRFRRIAALGLRGLVVALVVLAVADTQWVKTSPRLTVLYLLDQSSSIPEPQRKLMAEFVNESVKKNRDEKTGDRAGVIVFAKEAAVEYPPVEDHIQLTPKLETTLDTTHTNLAGALKLALATLPADSAKRVVIVTDGNENLGDAYKEAAQLADQGIGIDVVPIRYAARSEVAVEKLTVPPEVHTGQPFNLRVVLNNSALKDVAAPAAGKLQVFRKTRDGEQEISSQRVELPPGKRVFSLTEKIEAADAYTYSARFVPDDPSSDVVQQNKEATGFTQVRGQGRVLLIEDSESAGEFELLVDRLRRENINVTVINTDALFTSLSQLQPYDTVVLANVPREAFSDTQIQMLVANTRQLGAGLIMLGGPNSFGAGGWQKTELEAALPVDCDVKNQKVRPIGALALVIDRSGSMRGDKIEGAKAAAIAAAKVLGDTDYLTVTAFDVNPLMVVPLVKKNATTTIEARINRLTSDGGTDMRQAVLMAHDELMKAKDAGTRHVVILTDGLSHGNDYVGLAAKFKQEKITVSTVAVGEDADIRLLSQMAAAGGGRFYHSKAARVLPRIFQQEARMVSRPLVYERPSGLQPQIKYPHEILKGIDATPPPMTGYVLTTLKESPLVEVALQSPLPVEEAHRTLLATWNCGLGKTVAFTTDAGRRWSNSWAAWPNYDKLFGQMVRWSMRPSGDSGKFAVATDIRGDKVQVVINALNKDDEFLNFLTPTGSAVGPDMKPHKLRLTQTAPGRYVGEFDAREPGNYFLMIATAAGSAPILTGVDVPYSREFLDRESNENLLTALAQIVPAGSEPGLMIEARSADTAARNSAKTQSIASELAATNVFRHNLRPATSRQDAWPQLMLLASCLFFCDVFVRRVQVDFSWIPAVGSRIRNRLLRREMPPVVETLARLQGRKAAVSQSIAAQKSALRFEPSPDVDVPLAQTEVAKEAKPEPIAETPADSPTSRLLKVKHQLRDEQQR